jgi:hypothetical protein
MGGRPRHVRGGRDRLEPEAVVFDERDRTASDGDDEAIRRRRITTRTP